MTVIWGVVGSTTRGPGTSFMVWFLQFSGRDIWNRSVLFREFDDERVVLVEESVLVLGHVQEVRSSVIQSVSIAVVAGFVGWASSYHSVHQTRPVFAVSGGIGASVPGAFGSDDDAWKL